MKRAVAAAKMESLGRRLIFLPDSLTDNTWQ